MKNLSSKISVGIAVSMVGVSLLVPFLSLAQQTAPGIPTEVGPPPNPGITRVNDVVRILGYLVNVLFTIFMVIAVIFIFYAAFLYLTAKGEPEKISTANKQLVYSAVAIAVALVAVGVREVVLNIINRGV